MSSAARGARSNDEHSHTPIEDSLQVGRGVIRKEGEALLRLAGELDDAFCRAVAALQACRGSVIVSGMGKAGLVGQKVAATLASTGTRSHFLHPAEAIHGDLGRIHAEDVVLLLSHSGETEEVLRLIPSLKELGVPILAVTGRPHSQLARQATVTLSIGQLEEAGDLQLAPSTSTTAMMALGDALALAVSQGRGFTSVDFARFHPGGTLGRQLSRVQDVMRPLHDCRVSHYNLSVRHILVSLGRPGRRCGAVLLVDDQGQLTGIFTDSDLARLLESEQDSLLDQPIRQVMTNSPTTVQHGTMMGEAIAILTERKISELPVTDSERRPLGVIDITDVVAFVPENSDANSALSPLDRGSERELLAEERASPGPSEPSPPIILSLSNHRSTKPVDET